MVGNIIQALFGRMNNAPLGAALSVVMMLTVTLLVSALLWRAGNRRVKTREL